MKSFLPKRESPLFFSLSGFISGLVVLLIFTTKPETEMPSTHRLLCLGDSYTIGESILITENFPSQTVEMLRDSGYDFDEPEIVAKTGWTTDELQSAISTHQPKGSYDFVTLLIGVNNQYRGRFIADYKREFESLLKQAVHFANGKADHVIVLSIPDWGVTPFANDSDRKKVAKDIDDYNAANREIAEAYKANYIDITAGTREAANDLSLLAADRLHPSAKEYAKWSEKIYHVIQRQL